MGTILSSKVKADGKVVFEVLLNYDEAVQLRGHMDNIHVLSENVIDIKTHLATRGKNDVTKYFLIPKEMRKDLQLSKAKTISCQRIDNKTKTLFVYLVDSLAP